jgi:hypothetical protein
MRKRENLLRAAVLATALSVAGCGITEITNPGPTPDSRLDDPGAVPGIVLGMSYAMSSALNYLVEMDAVVSGELSFSGSFGNFGGTNGIVKPEDLNSTWSRVQRARFVSEQGIERMKVTLGDKYGSSNYAARANLLAGLANRFIGENFCSTVIDGGPLQDRSVSFERAEKYFTDAIAVGTAAGANEYVTAAYGGRAEVRAALGRWDEALVDAAKVPTNFSHNAFYSASGGAQKNAVADETHTTYSFTVWGSRWESVTNDPRVSWQVLPGKVSPDGKSPVYQQMKYDSLAAPIPLVKGAALRTLEAEAALRKGDVPGAIRKLNEERALYPALPALDETVSADSAWTLLRYERRAVTWLEGRSLWDASRWYAATGAAHDDFMKNRSKCLPVSKDEMDSNPNLK